MGNDPNSLPPAKSPFLTTAEAADYLRYRTPGGITMAVRRGWLSPDVETTARKRGVSPALGAVAAG
jgi:hypothetical protein